jgi:hypothetical protein
MTESGASASKSRAYFSYAQGAQAFNTAFTRAIVQIHKRAMAQYLLPENTQRFRHGGAWRDAGNPEAFVGQPQMHSAYLETRFDDIVDNNLEVIERSLRSITESLHQQFAKMIYSNISAVCEASGNTVDTKAEGSIEAAFIAMLEKIEFAVDRDGNISMPEFHVSPETGQKMLDALKNAPPGYQERVEALKARKTAEALAREAERRAKFVEYGPDACAS